MRTRSRTAGSTRPTSVAGKRTAMDSSTVTRRVPSGSAPSSRTAQCRARTPGTVSAA
ncbi:Uncharacterised protein [Mycobacteroides abscessus subsp. abscessus]|nr:Uncharacterised protein [Mycobacteroides abscessus subsp. abscessus]